MNGADKYAHNGGKTRQAVTVNNGSGKAGDPSKYLQRASGSVSVGGRKDITSGRSGIGGGNRVKS